MIIGQASWLADTWGMHGDVGWGWMTVMMGGMVLFWAVVIVGIVWLIRGFERRGSGGGEAAAGRESPIEILERRFAEGAISSEDYWARRQVLVSGNAEPNGARSEVRVAPSGGGGQR